MGSGPTTTQNTQQQSVSAPWQPAIPALTNLLGGIAGQNTAQTPQQQQAIQSLLSGAAGIPNFSGQGTGTVNNLFAGGGANNQAGTVQNAYGNLQNSLSPLTNPANLNPYNTPGFANALNMTNNNISNQINDQFAAAGRDLSPANTRSLATGLAQGEGGMIANQYNANAANLMGASNSLFGAGLNTGNALTGYNQMGNYNQLAGLSGAGAIPGLSMAPGQAQLSAANTAYGSPFANLGTQESLLTPIAALGGQTSGSGTSTTQTQTPLWQQLAGLGIAGASMIPGMSGMFGGMSGMFGGGSSTPAYGSQNGYYGPLGL